jgi:hypothetical protein
MRGRTSWVVAIVAGAATASADVATRSPQSPLIDRAYHTGYNLDHDEALALARKAVAAAPDDPAAHRVVATIVWLKVLFLRGAVTVDHFLGGLGKAKDEAKPPPALEAEFRSALARAIELPSARLARNARDVQARYDLGAAYALHASYTVSVERSYMAAFRSAKRAYSAQEDVLSRDPERAGASLVVGTYRYMVSALSLPTRLIAYVVGFGGGKERGIAMIETAAQDPRVRVDAAVTLLLVFTREGRHLDALRVAHELERECPRNRFFVLEAGAAAVRAGRAADAEATLTRGLRALDQDPRPKIPGERALWLYKRGMARVLLNHPGDAAADLNAALAGDPAEWVRGRIRLEFGKMADLAGRRADAIAEYRQARSICERAGDQLCVTASARLTGQPFRAR